MNKPFSVTDARYWVRIVLGSSRAGLQILRLTKFRDRIVRSGTDICIEGFPRSANSFLYHYFLRRNSSVTVAHHVHVPAQVAAAVRRAIPCVLLLREPLDAITSLLVANPSLAPDLATRSYATFHERIFDIAPKLVIAPFDRVIARPSETIEKVNRGFGTRFNCEDLQSSEKAEIFERLISINRSSSQPKNLVALPTEEKEQLKQRYRDKVRGSHYYTRARSAYERLKGFV